MATAAVEVVGLKEFRKELRQLSGPTAWSRELGKAHREIGKKVGAWSSGAASGMGGPFAHFAGSIKGRGGVTGARIGVAPVANATFWGAKKRTGWNAGNAGRPQHPHWVGASWEVGGAGGPYAINSTIRARMNQIIDMEGDAVDRVSRSAFPN